MTVAVGGCALGFSNLNANAINSNMAVSEIRKTISTVQYSTVLYSTYSTVIVARVRKTVPLMCWGIARKYIRTLQGSFAVL